MRAEGGGMKENKSQEPEEKKICESGFSLIFWLLDSDS
jgi:hypothetical protein